jgi:hypothetical protein
LGGTSEDFGRSIAVDAKGQIYVAGFTLSGDFPINGNSYNPNYSGGGDAFIAQLDPTSATLVYSTFFGGSGTEDAKKLLLQPDGHSVAIAGYTMSPNLPVTANAFQRVFGSINNIDPNTGFYEASNAFVAIVDLTAPPSQALKYSTYFGGSGGEVAYDLRRDTKGRFYLSGYTMSTNLPITSNAFYSKSMGVGYDGFVAVIDPTVAGPKGLVYSTYITSPGLQVVYGVDVDANGVIYVTGTATSNIFPGQSFPTTTGKQDAYIWAFTPQ